jgi:hypothetical protein
MKKNSPFKSIVPFLPLLLLYIIIVLIFSKNELVGDESRYMVYATNLTHGYYTDVVNPELRNGPGYPLVIAPLVLAQAPFITITLLNVLFFIIAVVFFFKTVSFYLERKKSVALGYLFGLYPASIKLMVSIHSESFAIFLACGFLYYFLKVHRSTEKKYVNVTLSATFLGILALTKVIFGYVIIAVALFYIIVYIFNRSKKIRFSLIVLSVGFLFCIPYLGYTYYLTGKAMYWGTGGGEILYWRSSPFSNEFGDWISSDVVLGKNKGNYFDTSTIIRNHGDFIQSLEPYSPVQRDSLYKEKAIENIKQYPLKFIQNTEASALRLFFNYPYSYTPQKITSYFYILPNIFLTVFLFLSLFLAIRNPISIPFEIRFIGLTTLIFIGGLILLDGRTRHLLPIMPLLLFFIIFVFKQLINIQVNENLDQNKLT